jgi:virginiamycin A acetyltransferase
MADETTSPLPDPGSPLPDPGSALPDPGSALPDPGSALPDPTSPRPIASWKGTAWLRNVVRNPRIVVGDFSYYDDSRGPEHFEARCVRYLFDHLDDRLVIGRFVAIAQGAQFIMNGANHPMDGFSTFPFALFGFEDGKTQHEPRRRGDTVIGHDVWIGREAVIMPGVSIGNGAIIGTRAVVARDVPPYAVVTGNPGRVTRLRFDAPTIAQLQSIGWWNWPIAHIKAHVAAITGADLAALRDAALRLS